MLVADVDSISVPEIDMLLGQVRRLHDTDDAQYGPIREVAPTPDRSARTKEHERDSDDQCGQPRLNHARESQNGDSDKQGC